MSRRMEWVIDEGGKSKFLLIGFYFLPETGKRKGSWRLLMSLRPEELNAWCVVGKFNEIISQGEKRRVS